MSPYENHDRINITPAVPEDVSIIIHFIRELAEYEKLSHEVKVNPKSMTEALFGPHPAIEALILRYDGQPAGYCLFFHNFSTFEGRRGLYVEDIYITPKYRRLKLGEAAFHHMGRLARERNCARLEFSVLDWNEPAIRFYERLGARKMGDWRIFRFDGASLDQLAR